MPTVVTNIVSIGPGGRFDPAAFEDGLIMAEARIVSTDSSAVLMDNGMSLTVLGQVHGHVDGILAEGLGCERLLVGAGGRVTGTNNAVRFTEVLGQAALQSIINNGEIVGLGDDGIDGSGSNFTLVNNGTVSGRFGVYYTGINSGNVVIINHGDISATVGAGVTLAIGGSGVIANHGTLGNGVVMSSDTGVMTLENTGTITADAAGVAIQGANLLFGDRLINAGDIFGQVSLGSGNTGVVNTGFIAGDLALGAGADRYRSATTGSVGGTILGEGGDDTIRGADGEDIISGGADRDLLTGGRGDDSLAGDAGNDVLQGGDGDDILDGLNDADSLFGGRGDDVVRGGDGVDVLSGGRDDDNLDGGLGDDTIAGGRGDDTITGNAGRDTYVFRPGDGDDVVTFFADTLDRVNLSDFDFTGFADMLTEATLSAVAGGVRIDFDTGDSLTLTNATLPTLTAADFLF